MTPHEKLAEAKAHLSDIKTRIESYSFGDRPSAPPAELLREERRVMAVVSWWKAEAERCQCAAKGEER